MAGTWTFGSQTNGKQMLQEDAICEVQALMARQLRPCACEYEAQVCASEVQ